MAVQERDLGDPLEIDVSTLSDGQFASLLDELSQGTLVDVGRSAGRVMLIPVSDSRIPEEFAPSPFAQVQKLMQ